MEMWNGVCPVCGSTEVYGKEGGIMGSAHPLYVKPAQFEWKRAISVHALICGTCGHVALQIPAHDMERLHMTFQEGGWTRLKN
jgi:hypothetical protein